MAQQLSSRIEDARRRAARAKRALGTAAAAGFLAVGGVAYAGHAGTKATGVGTTDSPVYANDDNFDFGSGSIAPSGGAQPQVGTGVS
jgi:hypothetical protein